MQIRHFSLSTYSFFISLLFHLLLFLISFPHFLRVSDSDSFSPQIPVSLSIVAPPMSASVAGHVSMPTVSSGKKAVPSPAVSHTAESSPVAKPSSGSDSGHGDSNVPGEYPGDRASAGTASPIVAVYPKSALNNEWTGTIVAEFQIDETGRVLSSRVLKSSGHELLDQAFIRSVQATRFEPKRVMGKAVRDTVKLSYEFKLQ